MRENEKDYLPELDELHRSFNDIQVTNRRINKYAVEKNLIIETKNGKNWTSIFFSQVFCSQYLDIYFRPVYIVLVCWSILVPVLSINGK